MSVTLARFSGIYYIMYIEVNVSDGGGKQMNDFFIIKMLYEIISLFRHLQLNGAWKLISMAIVIIGAVPVFNIIGGEIITENNSETSKERVVLFVVCDFWWFSLAGLIAGLPGMDVMLNSPVFTGIFLILNCVCWIAVLIKHLRANTGGGEVPLDVITGLVFFLMPICLLILTFYPTKDFVKEYGRNNGSEKREAEEEDKYESAGESPYTEYKEEKKSSYSYSYTYSHEEQEVHTQKDNGPKLKYFSEGMTLDELKRKYRSLARELHPDNASGNAEKFEEMKSEYEELRRKVG